MRTAAAVILAVGIGYGRLGNRLRRMIIQYVDRRNADNAKNILQRLNRPALPGFLRILRLANKKTPLLLFNPGLLLRQRRCSQRIFYIPDQQIFKLCPIVSLDGNFSVLD